jgi:hypothetical protein
MIFYHFKDLTDYFNYLKPSGWTYFDLDVEEVKTQDSVDFYAILTAYNTEKARVYVCTHKIGSTYATHAHAAASLVGKEGDPDFEKAIEAQRKADELLKKQRKDALVKDFKTAAQRIYQEVEFSEFERRWSNDALVHLPTSLEKVEVVGKSKSAGEEKAEKPKPAEKPEPQAKPATAEEKETEGAQPVEGKKAEDEGASQTRSRGVKPAASKQRLIGKRK